MYDEDVIPYRLERYREKDPVEWAGRRMSEFFSCMEYLLTAEREVKTFLNELL